MLDAHGRELRCWPAAKATFPSQDIGTLLARQDYAGAWDDTRGRCHRYVYTSARTGGRLTVPNQWLRLAGDGTARAAGTSLTPAHDTVRNSCAALDRER